MKGRWGNRLGRGAGFTTLLLVACLVIPAVSGATWPGQNGKIYFACVNSGATSVSQDICSINPDGSGLSNLTNTAAEAESLPDVSMDGKKLSFQRGTGEAARIWVMDPDGTNQAQVTQVRSDGTSWTPEGNIAFRAGTGGINFDFRVVKVDGSPVSTLRSATGSDLPPKFTADGRWLYGKLVPVSEGSMTLTQQVFVVSGGNEQQVTASDPTRTSNSLPSWSPDGSTIIYQRTELKPGFGNDDDLYSVPSTGGTEVRLTNTNGPVRETAASLSPDGTRLIFQQEDATHDFLNRHLMIADSNGSNPVPIDTPTLKSATLPVWAPTETGPPPPPGQAAFAATAPKSVKSGKTVPVNLRCTGDTRCSVIYSAKLSVPRKKKPAKKFTIKPARMLLEARTDRKVILKAPAVAKGLIKQAVKAGKSPSFTILATATQPDGPLIRKVTLKVRVKR